MRNRLPLHQRINNVLPSDRWVTLDDVCKMISSPSKSLVKSTLHLMPNVAWQRVNINNPKMPRTVWRWEFRKIEEAP